MRINLDHKKWECTGDRVHGRLSLDWPVVGWAGGFVILMSGLKREANVGLEGELCTVISWSSFVVMRLKLVRRKVAFAGCK